MTEGEYVCPCCGQTNPLPTNTEDVFNEAGRPQFFEVTDTCAGCGAELIIPIVVRFCFEVDETLGITEAGD